MSLRPEDRPGNLKEVQAMKKSDIAYLEERLEDIRRITVSIEDYDCETGVEYDINVNVFFEEDYYIDFKDFFIGTRKRAKSAKALANKTYNELADRCTNKLDDIISIS